MSILNKYANFFQDVGKLRERCAEMEKAFETLGIIPDDTNDEGGWLYTDGNDGPIPANSLEHAIQETLKMLDYDCAADKAEKLHEAIIALRAMRFEHGELPIITDPETTGNLMCTCFACKQADAVLHECL